ncbi:MAG: RNHCP domain-containing protein [Parcubacteria group bacterium]|nr:RNHCP domain-containing protein [Parcubacteria group bacterium]
MKNFQRKIEDFVCENCEKAVKGDGYTNHCPVCLYSKHVDINPGDRGADCVGLMEPVSCEAKKDSYVITHVCEVCKHKKRNKTIPQDNFEKILELSNF